LTIATKFGHPASVSPGIAPCSADRVRKAVDASLKRLRCERIDLYFIHFPDPVTPFEETLDALRRLLHDGKIGAYGVSNFNPGQLADLLEAADRVGIQPPAVVQEEYNLLRPGPARALLPVMESRAISLVPFFPLASGLLTGKYHAAQPMSQHRERIVRNFTNRFLTADNLRKVDALRALCERHHVSMVALALCWLLSQPLVGGVAIGASNADQVQANLTAAGTKIEQSLLADAETLMESFDSVVTKDV